MTGSQVMLGHCGRRRPGAVRWLSKLAAYLVSWLVLTACVGHAFTIEFQGRQIKRSVLALYDSKTEGGVHLSRLHKLAEMPLNHLGYMLDYHDVNTPLPDVASLRRYRGVISWFVEPLADAAGYVDWLDRVTASGLKYIMLGEVAPREIDEIVPIVNRVLGRIGLRSGNNFIELTHKAKIISQDPLLFDFEQKIDKVLPGFPVIEVKAATTRSHLVVEAPLSSGPIRSVPVATSDGGGFAAQNFTVTLDPNTNRLSWTINPFLFFSLALGDERFPIPDVTTVSGRRIYFSHIDGDGWNNQSEIEGYREAQALSVDVIDKEAIEPFPDLPVSVGLIAGDVQPLLGGNVLGIKAARSLYAKPQVEVGSHTHTHPYNWEFFESYNRQAEESKVKAYRPPTMPLRERLTAALMHTAGKTYTNPRYDPYIAGTDDLPRTYLRLPFDLQTEVPGALKFSEQFAPPSKKAKIYLWSGDTTPFEAAIAATRAAGVRNLNGGDSRLDTEFPSVAYVPPISRPIGKQRQIYSVNSNENTYTNDWTGPFGGQMMLEHTLRNTDTPRRLKGFNLYYHMYSGEKAASLRTIKYFLAMARASEVTPIPASDYAAMADDYFNVELDQVDLFSWAIKNRGSVATVRFDEADQLAVDMAASTGVIGWNRHAGSLYASLDPVVERPVVSLRARTSTNPAGNGPLLSLIHGRWRFSNVRSGDCLQSVVAQGFGPGEMVWRATPGKAFKISISRDGGILAEEIRWVDAQGMLSLRFAIDALTPVDLTFQCHE
jgi:hypothetical protein